MFKTSDEAIFIHIQNKFTHLHIYKEKNLMHSLHIQTENQYHYRVL